MDRFIPISTTNESIGLILLNNEQVFSLQESVGLYDGKEKTLNQTSGTIYLTSHRLIYVDSLDPHFNSCYLDLSLIRQTEYYAGFLKSSPKVTLFLSQNNNRDEDSSKESSLGGQGVGSPASAATSIPQRDWRYKDKDQGLVPFDDGSQLVNNVNKLSSSWICGTCGYSNDSSASQCQLCGVTKIIASTNAALSSSLALKSRSSSDINGPIANHQLDDPSPSSQPNLTVDPSFISAAGGKETSGSFDSGLVPSSVVQVGNAMAEAKDKAKEGISCPVCTFSNHPSMVKCEICDSPLANSQAVDQIPSSASQQTTSRDRTVSLLKKPDSSQIKKSASQNALESRSSSSSQLPSQQPTTDSVKLSFRKGGDRAFYGTMKKTLVAKDWLKDSNGKLLSPASPLTPAYPSSPAPSRPSSSYSTNPNRSTTSVDIDGRISFDQHRRNVGIEAILATNQISAQTQSREMNTAFSDLESLMRKAKEMVDLAEELNSKLLKSKQKSKDLGGGGLNQQEEEEAETLINSSLVRLGLKNPAFTKDMAESLEEYHSGLARELAGLLLLSDGGSGSYSRQPSGMKYGGRRRGGLMGVGEVLKTERGSKELQDLTEADRTRQQEDDHEENIDLDGLGRGIIGLDEVWCIWNRARGIALIPPQALRSASAHLPKITQPVINLRTFKSGLTVLHTPRFAEHRFGQRLQAMLRRREDQFLRDADGDKQKEGNGQSDSISSEQLIQRSSDLPPPSAPYGSGLSSLEVSNVEGIPLNLANEMIENCEMKFGSVVRDDGGRQGTRWFSNRFYEMTAET